MCPTTSGSARVGRVDGSWRASDLDVHEVLRRGLRWVRTTCDPEGRWQTVVWMRDHYAVSPEDDGKIGQLADNGVSVMLNLGLWGPSAEHDRARFKTAAEIERYMNFFQFSARQFNGRVACYEIWNEPEGDTPGWHVDLGDYLDVVRVAIPIVREEDPQASLAVGATRPPSDGRAGDYLLGICSSDVLPLVDVVTWHGASDVDRSVVERIVRTAADHGFRGAVMAAEPAPRSSGTTPDGSRR